MRSTRSLVAAACVAIVTAAPTAQAQLLSQGVEFQVNTTTTGPQEGTPPRTVARSADGSFVVVWADGFSSATVRAQRYDAAGVAAGTEFQVSSTPAYVGDSTVAIAPDGRFVVAWAQYEADAPSSYGILARRYDALGTADGTEFLVNAITAGDQHGPGVAMVADGSFVVVWESYGSDGDQYGTQARRFDDTGAAAGPEFTVNTYTTGPQYYAQIASAGPAGFVVVWESFEQDGNYRGIVGQRLDSAAAPVGTEFIVNTYTTYNQSQPALAAAADGEFVVVWTSYGQDGDYYSVHGQRFDAAGTADGTEFQVNAYTTGFQREGTVAMDDDGGFVVAWTDGAYSTADVVVRGFDATGAPFGDETIVNTYTTEAQDHPSIATDGSGGFVVAWTSRDQDGDDWGMFGQRLCVDADSSGLCDADEGGTCTPSPRTGCVEAATAKFQYSEKSVGGEKMKIRWGKLAMSTVQADFGDPVAGDTAMVACIYDDADSLVADFPVDRAGDDCGGRPCWRKKGSKGYGYKDKAGDSAGVAKLSVTSGDAGKGKADIGGKNSVAKGVTSLPSGVVPQLTLNLSPTIQLVVGGGVCVSAQINGVKRDDGVTYSAARVE